MNYTVKNITESSFTITYGVNVETFPINIVKNLVELECLTHHSSFGTIVSLIANSQMELYDNDEAVETKDAWLVVQCLENIKLNQNTAPISKISADYTSWFNAQ